MLNSLVALESSSYENSTDLSTVIPIRPGEEPLTRAIDSEVVSEVIPEAKTA